MTLEADVAALTTATTNLITQVNVNKATLDTAVSQAQVHVVTATAKAAEAAVSAGAADQSKLDALAIFGNTAAMNSALNTIAGYASTSQAQANMAVSAAAGASSVAQQDLSGVTAAALHRSPNAVTAMCVYDTSKDSDGGAWVERCTNTSWFQEALNGTYLPGGFASEMDARDYFGTLGAASIVTGDSSTADSSVGSWATQNGNGTVTAVGGRFRLTLTAALGNTAGMALPITTVVGQRYQITVDFLTANAANTFVSAGTASGNNSLASLNMATSLGTRRLSFVATGTTTYINVYSSTTWVQNSFAEVDNITVKPVSFAANPSGAFFQNSADGKFYRLYKNLLRNSNLTTGAGWTFTNASGTATQVGNAYTFGASAVDRLLQTPGAALSMPVGAVLTVGAKLSGSGSIRLYGLDGNGATTFTINVTLTGTPTWYTVPVTIATAGTGWGIGIYNNAAGTSGASFTIDGTQIEFGAALTTEEVKGADASQVETFRGNKAKFPRLAAVVAEAASVTIYDLTEPGRPMWGRYTGFTLLTGVTAAQGRVLLSRGVSGGGVYSLYFPADHWFRWNFAGGGFSGRALNTMAVHEQSGFVWDRSADNVLASGNVNAVAMTVLPDAPVDPVTGLLVPTIAVATAGGVSLIRHSGLVENTAASTAVNWIEFDRNRMLRALCQGGTITGWPLNETLPAGGVQHLNLSWKANQQRSSGSGTMRPLGAALTKLAANVYPATVAAGLGAAMTMYREHFSDATLGLLAYITFTYNSGWMVGDIRRCWLADTVTGAAGGAEIVTVAADRDFSSDTGFWTKHANMTIGGGVCAFAAVPASAALYRAGLVSTTPGRVFTVTYTVSGYSGGGACCNIGGGANGTVRSANGTYTEDITSGATGMVQFFASGTTTLNIDDISIAEKVADRSYKNKALTIYGTLTRTAVASAAQLVAYSGWSGSNYVQEPYSSDMDYVTGQWTCSAWVSIPALIAKSATVLPNYPVVGAEQITNGTFDVDTTGWTGFNGVITNPGQALRITENVVAEGNARFAVTTTSGKIYKLEFDVLASNGGGAAFFTAGASSSRTGALSSVGGTHRVVYLRASATGANTVAIATDAGNGSGFIEIDNASFREIGPTVIAERAHSSGPSIQLAVDAHGYLIATAFDGTTTRTVTTTAAYNTATMLKARASYTTDGTLSISVNGRVVATATGTPLLTMTNASAVTTIGNSRTLDAPFPGSIALVKWGATAPSQEAMLWMYEQEKHMFRASAQVTLPSTNSLLDVAYDDLYNRITVVDSGNEANFEGLVRVSTATVPAGSYTKAARGSGVKLLARSATNIGVDITLPSQNLKEELRNAENAARRARLPQTFDYVGGFTATVTNLSTALTVVTGLSVPSTVNLRGVTVTGTGIPAATVITDIVGSTIYISKPATATNAGVSISMLEFPLPTGYEAEGVATAGALKQEGSTKDWTRSYDGFTEKIVYGATPGSTAWVQARARRQA